MTKKNEQERVDDLATELRRALVECGAIIPTTPEEVALAEKHQKLDLSPTQIDIAFGELEKAINNPEVDLSFVKLNASILPIETGELSMAARNGCEIDESTRAKIEETVNKILEKPSEE